MIGMRVTKRGPLFSPTRTVKVKTAVTAALKISMDLGEAEIKKGYKSSPAPNVVGGRKTGHLSRGIRGQLLSHNMGLIAAGRFVYGMDVPYIRTVEHGRSASSQQIKPRRAKALRFKPRGSGKYIFSKSAKPFQRSLRGNPMFRKTAINPTYHATINKVFGKTVSRAVGGGKVGIGVVVAV